MSAKMISLSNQKGGARKSVTAANLVIGLARQGKKVLLIDGNPQASLTISLGYPIYRSPSSGQLWGYMYGT